MEAEKNTQAEPQEYQDDYKDIDKKLVPMLEKERGNQLFKEGKYLESIKSYSKSIMSWQILTKESLLPLDESEKLLHSVYIPAYSNMGMAYMKLGMITSALKSLDSAI